jgi:hypothetical protein
VLILQIGGHKRWLINAPQITLPHSSQIFKPEAFSPGPRLMEIELEAGDLLYLPRGLVHSTVTSHSYSAHVTIGVQIFSWVECVSDAVPGAVDKLELRRALPPGFASNPELRAPVVEKIRQLLAGTAAQATVERRFDQIVTHVLGSKRRAAPVFRADLVVVSLDSMLRAPPSGQYKVAQNNGHIVLTFEGRTVGFPTALAPVLHAVCTRPEFRPRELLQQGDEQLVLKLTRFLHRIGFLQPVR